MGIRSRRRRRTRAPEANPPAPPPSRRRRLNSDRDDHVHVQDDLPRSPERRDWAALPRDVLWVILSLVPQEYVLGAAGLVCASWRGMALDEPLLWRRIDLPFEEDDFVDPPAGWREMACAAVRRSTGRCESFGGRVDGDVLLFLAGRSPSLRSLHVTSQFHMPRPSEEFVMLAKKLPMLEQHVLSHPHSQVEQATLAALVDHCPRLQLLHADGCRVGSINRSLRERLKCTIKDLQLPRLVVVCGRWPGRQE